MAAELVIALKVASRVPSSVKLTMSCGEGCEAQVDIAEISIGAMAEGETGCVPNE